VITLAIVATVVVFPLVYALRDLYGGAVATINFIGIFVVVFSAMWFLYGARTVLLVQGYDIDANLQLSKRGSIHNLRKFSKEEFEQTEDGSIAGKYRFGNSNANPFETAKAKNLLSRRGVCIEQVSYWQSTLLLTEALMLMQAEEDAPVPSMFTGIRGKNKSVAQDLRSENCLSKVISDGEHVEIT
jgi:hypothetical protein